MPVVATTNTGAKSLVYKLNNGITMPALGLGVYQSSPEQTGHAVETAIANGYRLIDTAAAYFNERQVGEGIKGSGIVRSDVFLTTKLWISDYGYEAALRAFNSSLRKLGLDYIDLYLLHWPVPTDFDTTVDAYRALEKLLAERRVRAIGVCNFSPKHLENLIARSEVVPAVNQVELHPFFTQRDVREADSRRGIITQAWSPIGGVNRYWTAKSQRPNDPLKDATILEVAQKHGKTPAQVILRWHIEHGVSPIPKSVRPERIVENIDIFDFSLTSQEVTAIDGVDTKTRGGPNPEEVNSQLFNLSIPD